MSWLNLLPTEKLIQTLGIHLAIHYCWRRPEMHTSSSLILSWRFTAISFHCHSNAKDFRPQWQDPLQALHKASNDASTDPGAWCNLTANTLALAGSHEQHQLHLSWRQVG